MSLSAMRSSSSDRACISLSSALTACATKSWGLMSGTDPLVSRRKTRAETTFKLEGFKAPGAFRHKLPTLTFRKKLPFTVVAVPQPQPHMKPKGKQDKPRLEECIASLSELRVPRRTLDLRLAWMSLTSAIDSNMPALLGPQWVLAAVQGRC